MTTIIIMLCITIISGLSVFYNHPMDKDIKNVTWFNYNIKTGTYDILKIEESKLTYMYDGDEYDGCSYYTYNSKSKKVVLDCGKEIEIKDFENNNLTLRINGEAKTFFKATDDSINYEFQKYYGKSITEYKEDKNQIKDIIKVDYSKILEFYNSNEKNLVVYIGDGCNNIECTIALGVLEKWSVDNSNVYFIDSTNLTQTDINKMYNINIGFSKEVNYYNSNYPLILIVGNKEIYDNKYFKCNGFDCTMWKDYAKDIKVIQ